MDNYAKAFAEVDVILDYLIEEDYNKIPQEIIDVIHENKDDNYIFEYDEEIELKDYDLLPETRAILYNLFRDYLATQEQREKIKKWQQEDRINAEIKKKAEFKGKEEFFPKNKKIEKDTFIQNSIIEYKESIFKKIANWFKNLLHK